MICLLDSTDAMANAVMMWKIGMWVLYNCAAIIHGLSSKDAKLDWMDDGRELWESIRHLQPTILTGLPMGNWAEPQKRLWCSRELGKHVPVITCMSKDKYNYCTTAGSILIDDRESLRPDWERMGGIFMHHTSTQQTLEKMRTLLPTDSIVN
ncbi:unnamed protein product [Choristocarpus tenellus]